MNDTPPKNEARANGQAGNSARPPLKGVSAGLFEEDAAALNALSSTLQVSRSVLIRSVIHGFLAKMEAGHVELAAAPDGEVQVSWKDRKPKRKTAKKKRSKKRKAAKKARGKKKASKGKK